MNFGARVHGEGQLPMLFQVDENLDVLPDSVLLVNNPEAETRISVIERNKQFGQGLSPGFDHT